ncbi:hypothetical protein ACWY4P_43775 [Streptomyces sp. LZ34]
MAAVAGAAIGAPGAVGGGWLTVHGQSRQQRRQQQAEHRRWRDEVRRNAYNACLASAKELSAAWWKMSDRLWEEGSTPEQWQARFVEAHDAWTRFSTAVASVTVAGPRQVADAADALRTAMYEWEMVGLQWYEAARREGHGRLDHFDTRFNKAAKDKRIPDRAFQAAAREALGTED